VASAHPAAASAATWCIAFFRQPLGSGVSNVFTAAFAVAATAAAANFSAATAIFSAVAISGVAATTGAPCATTGGTATTTHLFACALVRKCGRLMRANQVV